MRAISLTFLYLALLCALSGRTSPCRAEELFEISSIEVRGRSVAAELAELNGDGRIDLFVVALVGIPPEEQRTIYVYLQRPDHSFPPEPDHAVEVPPWTAAYDVADVRKDSPGDELVLLNPKGVTLLSLADGSGKRWELEAPGPSTMGVAADERGFDRLQLVFPDFGPEPWLLVPQIGQLTALSPDGDLRARLAVPRRANYFIIPTTGLFTIESDFQIFVDSPKLATGDVNGDGRVDLVSATRHEIRTFLRNEDGSFPFEPSRSLPLRMVTASDHIRGSGGVASEMGDIDGDGRLDLVITHVRGSFSDATTTTYIYMNRDGGWQLDQADQVFHNEGSVLASVLQDLDGDGLLELIRLEFRFTLFEVVEFLLSRAVDMTVWVHRYGPEFGIEKKPWVKKKLSLPFSFRTFRFRGFLPTSKADLNSDGYLDLVLSGGGQAIEIYLGGPGGRFTARSVKQKLPTSGIIHFADFDADGLLDFVLLDPHHFDVPIRIGRNRGILPGTLPMVGQPPLEPVPAGHTAVEAGPLPPASRRLP